MEENIKENSFNKNVIEVYTKEPGFTGYKGLDWNRLDDIEDLINRNGDWISNDRVGSNNETVLYANSGRKELFIQNLGIYPLFVKYGKNPTSSDFNFILTSGSVALAGDGGTLSDLNYTGEVSVYSDSNPTFIAWERGASAPTGFWKDCRDGGNTVTDLNNFANSWQTADSLPAGSSYGPDGGSYLYVESDAFTEANSITWTGNYRNTSSHGEYPYIIIDWIQRLDTKADESQPSYARILWNDVIVWEWIDGAETVNQSSKFSYDLNNNRSLLNGQYGEFRVKFEYKNINWQGGVFFDYD
jgi:hypothetical protein